jgi:hypothetical protein
MLIRDTIGCLTHIECGQIPAEGSDFGQTPVTGLVSESDHTVQDTILFNRTIDLAPNRLLCILHGSRLDRNDPRCLERLRNCDDPNGHLSAGFENAKRTAKFIHIKWMIIGDKVIPCGKSSILKPSGPGSRIPFLILRKAIRDSAWAMHWKDISETDLTVDLTKDITK